MAVFKRKYISKSGKATVIQKYSVDFRDHAGIVRRVAAFIDRSASLELERQLKITRRPLHDRQRKRAASITA